MNASGFVDVAVYSNSDSRETLCGMLIHFRSGHGSALATFGGLIEIVSMEGKRAIYGLTAAHPLRGSLELDSQKPSSLDPDDENESRYDDSEQDDFIRVWETNYLKYHHSAGNSASPPLTHHLGKVCGSFSHWVLISIPVENWLPNLLIGAESQASLSRAAVILTSRGPSKERCLQIQPRCHLEKDSLRRSTSIQALGQVS